MDIAFDDGTADRLITACRDAVRTLEGQRGGRQSATGKALQEFRGVFADAFRDNVEAERGSRTSLVGILEGLADQVAAAKRAATVERARLVKVAAWEAEHAMAYRAYSGLLVDEAPRPDMTPGDRPVIYVPSARQSLRAWPGGGTSGTSSADPDDLESAITVLRGQDDAADSAGNQVVAAVGAFEEACSWVLTDADGIRGGFRRFINDNRDDTTKLAGIAAAFRAAGGSGDIGAVMLSNSLLVLAEAPASLSGTALLALLSTATNADLKALAGVKGWQQTLQALDPGKIATWWAGMDSKDSTSGGGLDYSIQQALLLGSFPAMFGSLDGMPALARVRANQLNAGNLLKEAEAELAAARKAWAIGEPHGDPSRTSMLENKVAYLKQVQAGTVQAYLLDPSKSRIIEMIGTPDANTQRVITYVPGTYTNLNSFYTGDARRLPNQLVQRIQSGGGPGTVAFAYKDGYFPGERDSTIGPEAMNPLRITEANDPSIAAAAGAQLAQFETGMRTDPMLEGAQQSGIGWSWGLTNVTSSEMSGAHYQQVFSLSGAGMRDGWKPSHGTDYYDKSYPDILQVGQDLGVVWGGNNPRTNPAFEHGDYYTGPDDGVLRGAGFLPIGGIPAPYIDPRIPGVLLENHTLISTDSPDNRQLINDLARDIRQ